MVSHHILKLSLYPLTLLPIIYFSALTILLNPWAQRQALYIHNLRLLLPGHDPNKPEQFGFLKNQVQPFYLRTPDGEILHGWHVLPLGVYVDNEHALVQQGNAGPVDLTTTAAAVDDGRKNGEGTDDGGVGTRVEDMLSFKLLMQDPESKVVVNFHGNAGTVAQGWRTDTYRSLTSIFPVSSSSSSSSGDGEGRGRSANVHLLTIDYRGFGYSTGSPSEEGLITDGTTLVKFLIDKLGISPERIVLVGQSLGTAVTTAVAERLVVDEGIAIRNIVLVAAFANVPTLLLEYRIGGLIPVLAPLKRYPTLSGFYTRRVLDTWYSDRRMGSLVKAAKEINVFLVHARNDHEIPWQNSDVLFHAAANATSERGMTGKQIDGAKQHQKMDDGGFVNEWITRSGEGGKKYIRQEVSRYGGICLFPGWLARLFTESLTGHNRVATYPVAAKAVLRALSA